MSRSVTLCCTSVLAAAIELPPIQTPDSTKAPGMAYLTMYSVAEQTASIRSTVVIVCARTARIVSMVVAEKSAPSSGARVSPRLLRTSRALRLSVSLTDCWLLAWGHRHLVAGLEGSLSHG